MKDPNRGNKKGICEVCNIEFNYYACEQSGKYCSNVCSGKVMVKYLGTRMLGKKWSDETRKKFTESNSGEKHWHWSGDKIGYKALHRWVERHRGKPQQCEHCGKAGYIYKGYDWANISGKYLRDLNDFIRICKKCHRKYDWSEETVAIWRKNLIKYALPKAKEWHQSDEAKPFHRDQAKYLPTVIKHRAKLKEQKVVHWI